MMALFTENGPFIVDQKMRLVRNQYSWTQNFSMIFIDNPVGTGFSYTKDTNGFVRNQVDVSQHLYEGLQQFFTIFSEYRKNDFYVTGESYAGKYVPAIGYKLHQMSKESNITFRGIAIGNGYIDPLNMLDIGSFLLSIGLIDEEEAIYFYDIQNRTAEAIKNRDFKQAFRLQDQLIGIKVLIIANRNFSKSIWIEGDISVLKLRVYGVGVFRNGCGQILTGSSISSLI